MSIGENIKKYRKNSKMTQTELSDKLNKSLRTIQKYESNDIIPSLQILKDIASVLNIQPNLLIGDDMNGLVSSAISNMSDEELITYKNKQDFKYELDNQIPLYNKLNPKEMELIYLNEINKLKYIIKNQDNTIEQLHKMIELQKNIIDILKGDTDGE